MKKYFGALVILIFSAAIGLAQGTASDKVVIFPLEKGVNSPNDSPTARFTPTQEDVDAMDAGLQAYIKAKYPKEITVVVDNYYRQYYGFISSGQRLIHVSATCKKPEKFAEELLLTKGGGTCNFSGNMNVQSKKITVFKFNAGK